MRHLRDGKIDAGDARIREEAARWLMRIEAGDSSEDAPDYRAWLESSSDHVDAMMRARIAWGVMGDHAHAPELIVARRDALARTARSVEKRWRAFSGRGWRALGLAAAAALLIALPFGRAAFDRQPAPQPIASASAAQLFATDVAETRVITLADNSRISLDASSSVSVTYTATARDIVLLRGQAFFDVAKDRVRPFRVTAGDRVVVATGTAFNMEYFDHNVLVTLIEGEVIVAAARESAAAGGAAVRLAPGQQLVASADAAPIIDSAPNVERTIAWRSGKVFLQDDPLPIAVERMNRYSRIRLVVADERLTELQVGGVFNAGDTDAFVSALEATFPLEARRMSADSIELYFRE